LDHLLVPNLGEAHRNDVGNVVKVLVCAYSMLVLQWRRKFPAGTALEWLVFQTTTNVVDAALESIWAFLAIRQIDACVAALVLAAKKCVGGDLLLVVDEAQVLAQHGRFASSNLYESSTRPLLSPFVRLCRSHSFRRVWFAGTSLSLRIAQDFSFGMDAKRVPDLCRAPRDGVRASRAFSTIPD
jgi:hypothetical protein